MEVYEIKEEKLSPEKMLSKAVEEQECMHLILKFVGWFCFVFGLQQMLSLFPALLSTPLGLILYRNLLPIRQ